jgi:predicted LPLAT superfamily acyltransferase
MLELLIAFADTDSIIPEETSARVVWAVIAAVILGLYFLMKSARRKATQEYWDRRKADEERIANDPDMRKD